MGTFRDTPRTKDLVLTLARTIHLPDGRKLAYDDLGDRDGVPVIFFHGVPGSRLYWSLAGPGDPASESGVRLLSVDRPGMGGSSPHERRTFLSFAEDISFLCDRLGIGDFSALGFSGGAPYALAVARVLGERVRSVGLIAPMGDLGEPRLRASVHPVVRRMLAFAQRATPLSKCVLADLIDARRLISKGTDKAWSLLPAADRRVLSRDDVRTAAETTMMEAVRQGLGGACQDAELLGAPWQIPLSKIDAPVELFTGCADPWSTDEIAHWFQVQLPRCRVHRRNGEGHFTLLVNHSAEVLDLVAAWATEKAREPQVARERVSCGA